MLDEMAERKALMRLGARVAREFMLVSDDARVHPAETGLRRAITLIAQELAGGPDHPETGVYVSKLMDAGEALLKDAKA